MRSGDFSQPPVVDHTFSTGRTAVLLERLPTSRLLRTGQWDEEMLGALQAALEGDLEDAELAVRLVDAVAIAMWHDPKIVDEELADADAGTCALSWLDDQELAETFTVAMGGAALAAAFRDAWLAVLAEDGRGRADAAHDAVEPARPGGKPRRSGRRPAGHAAAAGSRAARA